jgi:hypothetical protein
VRPLRRPALAPQEPLRAGAAALDYGTAALPCGCAAARQRQRARGSRAPPHGPEHRAVAIRSSASVPHSGAHGNRAYRAPRTRRCPGRQQAQRSAARRPDPSRSVWPGWRESGWRATATEGTGKQGPTPPLPLPPPLLSLYLSISFTLPPARSSFSPYPPRDSRVRDQTSHASGRVFSASDSEKTQPESAG